MSERTHRDSPTKNCTVEGCENPLRAKGLCSTHYNKLPGANRGTREGRRKRLRKTTARRHLLIRGSEIGEVPVDEIGDRDGWICGICKTPVDRELVYPDRMSATTDHIVPFGRGGPHTYENLQLAHLWCNIDKRDAILPLS